MDNNYDDKNDTKCLEHNQEYIYICKNCSNLICIKCLTHGQHKSHEIQEITVSNIKPIVKDFKSHSIYTLNGYLKSDKVIMESMNSCFQDIELKYQKNKEEIDQHFNQLISLITNAQKEIHSKLDLEFKKNKEYYEKLLNQFENDQINSKSILNRNYNLVRRIINFSDDAQLNNNNNNNNTNNNNNNNKDLESLNIITEELENDNNYNNNNNNNIKKYYSILKDSLTTRNLIDERIDRSRLVSSNGLSPIKSTSNSHFKDFIITFNKESFEKIKETIHSKLNSLYVVKITSYQDLINFNHNMMQKKFSIGPRLFHLTNGEPIPMDIEHLALSSDIDIISVHNTLLSSCKIRQQHNPIKSLFFSNQFQHPISAQLIPEGVEELFISGLKHQLLRGSIPNSVKSLFLFNDFNQELSNDFIPPSVSSLSIYNIKYPIEPHQLPLKSITKLTLHQYQFPIVNGMIPNSVTNLLIGNIKYPISNDSIPSSVVEITFFENYQHQIEPNQLPHSLLRLTLSKIKHPLNVKHCLPPSLKELIFTHGYSHPIVALDIIPPSVSMISLGNIGEPLTIHSIPDTVESIQFADGFPHKIQKDTIKHCKSISFYDIKQPLCHNSIPSSIKEIHFQDGFNHQLLPGIIPQSVETIFIYNIKSSLVEGSIPHSCRQLCFFNGYQHQILPGHIPFSIEKLIICDIEPLIIGSIPPTLGVIQISPDYKYKIDNSIIPSNVKIINCQE